MIRITKESLKNSYKELCRESLLDLDYILLLLLSSVICFFGFRMQNTPVIIGSMVISPLLYSILGIGISLLFKDFKQFGKEILSFLIEISLVLLTIFILGKLFTTPTSNEIARSVISDRLDYFFVALASGIASTFTLFGPNKQKNLVGVAIAVALIPPIVLLGISISEGNGIVLRESFETVFTNILGIILGSTITLGLLKILSSKKVEIN